MWRKNRYIYRSRRKFNRERIAIFVIAVISTSMFVCQIRVNRANKHKNKIFEEQTIEVAAKLEEDKEREKEEQIKQEQERKAKMKANQRKAEYSLTAEDMDNLNNIYKSDNKRVFLTFDDGPSSSVTPRILDLLKEEDIKATFFVLGTQVEANPELVKREYEEGHAIANHGYTHKYSEIYASEQNVFDEFNKTQDAVRNALGNDKFNSNFFRFPGGVPGGVYNSLKRQARDELANRNVYSIDWNCLSKDAEGAKTTEDLISNIKTTAGQKNSVVALMHDAAGKILTYESLKDVINYFRDSGYEFKTLYDLVSEKD